MTDTSQPPPKVHASRQLLTVGGSDRLMQGMVTAAAPLLFLHYTSSEAWVGLGNALQYSSWMLFGLAAGALSDVYDRARLIRLSSWIRMALAAVAGTLAAVGDLGLGGVVVVVACLAASLVFTDTALNASLPALYGPDQLVKMNSKLSVVQSTAGVVAPIIATSVLSLGDSWLFLLLLLPTLPAIAATGGRALHPFGAPTGRRLREVSMTGGFRKLILDARLRVLILGVAFLNLLSGAFLTILPILVVHDRGLDATSFGFALAVKAGALILANILIARSVRDESDHLPKLLALSLALRVISFALVGVFTSYPLLLIAMIISGTGTSLWNVPSSSLALEASRGDDVASTLASFKMAATLWTPLGAALGGAAFAATSGSECLLAMSAVAAVGSVFFWFALRRTGMIHNTRPGLIKT